MKASRHELSKVPVCLAAGWAHLYKNESLSLSGAAPPARGEESGVYCAAVRGKWWCGILTRDASVFIEFL